MLGRRRGAAAAATSLLVLAGVLGYAVADAYDAVPGVLTLRPEPTPPPPFPVAPGARGAATSPSPVLPAAGVEAALPDPAVLAALLTPVLTDAALGPSVGAVVADGLTGEQLFALDPRTAREPASVVKLLTGAAALSRLGPDRTVPTRVVAGSAPGEVLLVGGGDVLLSAGAGLADAASGRAGLADLAAATATALRAEGTGAVRLRVDDTLFSGPTTGPGWTRGDIAAGFVAPVTALAVDAGRVREGRYAPRVEDPALAAAATFAALLTAAGVPVAGDVERAAAPAGAPVLAEVRSAPLADVVGYVLAASDNTAAEALARLVAADRGLPTTFEGAARAVLDELAELGVDVSGATLADGSGLSDGSALPADVLVQVLAAAASQDRPQLRPLLTGLPVAGLEGTLGDRFAADGAVAGVGTVRAKTGSLTGVTSLAGTVTDADGRLLVFAVLADAVPATVPARRAVDGFAAALAACGCR